MPRKGNRKTTRKSRKTKLSVSYVQAKHDSFATTPSLDWEKIQAAYFPLSDVAKTRLLHIARNYLWQDRAEHDAPFLDDALASIARVKKLSLDLLNEQKITNDPNAHHARSLVHQRFSELRNSDITDLLIDYCRACNEAAAQLKETSENSGFLEGAAWRSMVWGLLDLAEQLELPHKVAKPSGERTRQESKFVAFVREIQRQLPDVLWKPPTTSQALATAIYNVKRERGLRRAKLGANRPQNSRT
jgi:hypothetical protein